MGSGTGLTGGPITGSGTLSLASGYQLPQSCRSGQVAQSDGSGGWSCGSANVTQMMGGSIGAVFPGGEDYYLAPVGLSTADKSLSNVAASASAVASTAGNLSVQVATPPGSSVNGWVVSLLVNWTDSS